MHTRKHLLVLQIHLLFYSYTTLTLLYSVISALSKELVAQYMLIYDFLTQCFHHSSVFYIPST